MNLLFLGGTVFVGRHMAEAALARGHQVTLFHRGSKGTGIIQGVEEILGDRSEALIALQGRTWDAVIDTCGYVPRVVRLSVEALADSIERYLFVSTISVYEEGEDGELQEFDVSTPLETEEVTGDTYGPLKMECENAVVDRFGERALIVRPGLVAGPFDPTNRFTYWVDRFGQGGDVLTPQCPDSPLELIDARDLGAFSILAVERGLAGVFDVAGPLGTFGQMISVCNRLNPSTTPVWASLGFLEENDVHLWSDLPLATPPGAGALMKVTSARAVESGLVRRDLFDTAVATWEWAKDADVPSSRGHGMSREREREVLGRLPVHKGG